jgi:hypothetical protein
VLPGRSIADRRGILARSIQKPIYDQSSRGRCSICCRPSSNARTIYPLLISEWDPRSRSNTDRRTRSLRRIMQSVGRRSVCPSVSLVSPETMSIAERELLLCFILCETFACTLVNERLTRALVDLMCEKVLATGFKLWSFPDFRSPFGARRLVRFLLAVELDCSSRSAISAPSTICSFENHFRIPDRPLHNDHCSKFLRRIPAGRRLSRTFSD